MDNRAKTYDESGPHPLSDRIDQYLRSLDWVQEAKSRVRDEGHVFHIESFVVPKGERSPSMKDLEDARQACIDLDWKVQDMVIVTVAELPEEFLPGIASSGGEQ